MGIFEVILIILLLAVSIALACVIFKGKLTTKKVDKQGKRPVFIDLGLDIVTGFMETHCQRNIEYVSRHAISEQDVKCPRCYFLKKDILLVEQGNYSGVHWTWVNNGVERHKNECVFCDECQNWLLASPDTEHNDHKNNEDDPPEYFYFVRKSELDVVREKYGEGVTHADPMGIHIQDTGDREETFTVPALPTNPIDDKPITQGT